MYVWQMNDGRWHVSHYTHTTYDIRMNELDRGYETEREARCALANWQKKYPDAVKPRW